MLKFKKILAPLTLSISMVFSLSSFAGSGHHADENELREIFKQLDLNQTQAQDVRHLMQQGREDKQVYRLDMREISSQIETLIQNSAWDQAAVEAALQQRMDLVAKIGWHKATQKNQLWQVLTPAQQAEFTQLVEQRDHQDGKQQKSLKFLETLDLSDQQAAEIDKTRADFAIHTAFFKGKHQEFRQAQRALFTSDSLNESNWQALRVKYQDDFLTMALAKAQNRHTIWNILNADQQTQLLKKKRQRQRQGRNKDRL